MGKSNNEIRKCSQSRTSLGFPPYLFLTSYGLEPSPASAPAATIRVPGGSMRMPAAFASTPTYILLTRSEIKSNAESPWERSQPPRSAPTRIQPTPTDLRTGIVVGSWTYCTRSGVTSHRNLFLRNGCSLLDYQCQPAPVSSLTVHAMRLRSDHLHTIYSDYCISYLSVEL
jgi:hypothetical protein